MEKLYAYADETGQDTKGIFFLIAVVVGGRECDWHIYIGSSEILGYVEPSSMQCIEGQRRVAISRC